MLFSDVIILSLIQAITEFLPISSSGHLIFFHNMLNMQESGSVFFHVAIHLGTVLSIIVFFHKDIKLLLKDILFFITGKKTVSKLSLQLFISAIPAVILGALLLFSGLMETVRILPIISLNLIVFGIILYVVDNKQPEKISFDQITMKQSLIIGLAQAIALFPGVSRSGICMTAARLLKIDKISSVKYLMLMAIPIILGATLLTMLETPASSIETREFLLGILVSFIFGLIVIKFLLEFVKRFSLKFFMFYRIILGFIILLYYYVYII